MTTSVPSVLFYKKDPTKHTLSLEAKNEHRISLECLGPKKSSYSIKELKIAIATALSRNSSSSTKANKSTNQIPKPFEIGIRIYDDQSKDASRDKDTKSDTGLINVYAFKKVDSLLSNDKVFALEELEGYGSIVSMLEGGGDATGVDNNKGTKVLLYEVLKFKKVPIGSIREDFDIDFDLQEDVKKTPNAAFEAVFDIDFDPRFLSGGGFLKQWSDIIGNGNGVAAGATSTLATTDGKTCKSMIQESAREYDFNQTVEIPIDFTFNQLPDLDVKTSKNVVCTVSDKFIAKCLSQVDWWLLLLQGDPRFGGVLSSVRFEIDTLSVMHWESKPNVANQSEMQIKGSAKCPYKNTISIPESDDLWKHYVCNNKLCPLQNVELQFDDFVGFLDSKGEFGCMLKKFWSWNLKNLTLKFDSMGNDVDGGVGDDEDESKQLLNLDQYNKTKEFGDILVDVLVENFTNLHTLPNLEVFYLSIYTLSDGALMKLFGSEGSSSKYFPQLLKLALPGPTELPIVRGAQKSAKDKMSSAEAHYRQQHGLSTPAPKGPSASPFLNFSSKILTGLPTSLIILDLRFRCLMNDGAKELTSLIEKSSLVNLRYLNLLWNEIEDVGVFVSLIEAYVNMREKLAPIDGRNVIPEDHDEEENTLVGNKILLYRKPGNSHWSPSTSPIGGGNMQKNAKACRKDSLDSLDAELDAELGSDLSDLDDDPQTLIAKQSYLYCKKEQLEKDCDLQNGKLWLNVVFGNLEEKVAAGKSNSNEQKQTDALGNDSPPAVGFMQCLEILQAGIEKQAEQKAPGNAESILKSYKSYVQFVVPDLSKVLL